MKKLLYLLLLLPLGFLPSCNDDDDFPSVEITATYDNVVQDGNVLYLVQGTDLKLVSVVPTSLNGNNTAIANMFYELMGPGGPIYFRNIVAPYAMDFKNLVEGTYYLGMSFTILQVDKTLAYGYNRQKIVVVASAEDLPEGKEPTTASFTWQINPNTPPASQTIQGK